MAIPRDSDLTSLGPWPAGANNLALETSVPRTSYRRAVNVDVTDDGKVVRRAGRTKIIEAVEPTHLFGYGSRAFFVEGQTLYGFEWVDGQATAPLELYTGFRPDAHVAHCLIDPDIFVSDGNVALRITPSNAVSLWSIATPDTPGLTVTTGGTLAQGRYHVAITHRAPTGEESAVSLSAMIEVSDGELITVALPPCPTGFRTVIYTTKPNGTELLLLASVPSSVSSLAIQKVNLSRPPATEDMDPMPGGSFAALWNGRLLIGVDNLVYWSEPLHYGLTKAMYNFLELAEPVTMIAAVETANGFFIGQQSRTYFASGADPAQASLQEAYPAGVIAGTLQMIPGARLPLETPPAEPVPMWLASNGVFCVGMPDGTVLPLTQTRYATQQAQTGAALFEQRQGKSRYIATLKNPSENTFAMSDSFTAEVVRNGN